MQFDREAYDSFLATSAQRSVFAESWWLDTVCGENGWQPIFVHDKHARIVAAWPLPTRKTRSGFVAYTPPYSPMLGPQLATNSAASRSVQISSDVKHLKQLSAAVEQSGYVHVEAGCMPELDYWTPLSWFGYSQTTRTTWRIPAGTSGDEFMQGMRRKTRWELKAARESGLTVGVGSVEDLLTACAATFRRSTGSEVPNRALLAKIADKALALNRGSIYAVRTSSGELASAGLFVHDDRFVWNLANGRCVVENGSGAATLLQCHAIEAALASGLGYDFEGSMLETIEQFVRGFGGTPHQYSALRKSSPKWRRVVARKRLAKRVLGRLH